MENPIAVDNGNTPLVTRHNNDCDDDNDYDGYSTPNTSRVDQTTFTTTGSTDKQSTSTLQFRKKVKRDKLAVFYRDFDVRDGQNLINLDQFSYAKNIKKGTAILKIYNPGKWVTLTKHTREFLAPKTLTNRFGGLYLMKHFLGIDEILTLLEQSFKAATKLKGELPIDTELEKVSLMELSPLAEDIYSKTQESSQNTDLDIKEFSGIEKAFQTRQCVIEILT